MHLSALRGKKYCQYFIAHTFLFHINNPEKKYVRSAWGHVEKSAATEAGMRREGKRH